LGGLYLAELGLKLLACGALVEYAALGRSDPALQSCLENLARPSLGHWWEFGRRLVPVLAEAACPGYDAVRRTLLGATRDDMPRAAGLDALLREMLGLGSGSRTTVRLSELFDRLVQLRNKFGHGAQAALPEGFHRPLGAALLSGLAEVYGRLDLLAGGRLVFIGEVRQAAGTWIVERWELTGEHQRAQSPLELPRSETARLPDGERVYLARGSGADEILRPLYPLLLYDAESEQAFVLNARRGRRQAQWLSYTSGREIQQEATASGQHLALLAQLLHMEVDAEHASAWAARSIAEEPASEATELPGQRTLGEFELISELGRGGMGVVYRAWQPSLGRQVAVKKLLDSGEKSTQRFAREIRALGRVEHPNLVKVYTSGSVGDEWFYAMELVEGAPLSSICQHLQESGTQAKELNLETWHDAVSTACTHARQSERQLATAAKSDVAATQPRSGSTAETQEPRSTPAAVPQTAPHHLRSGRGYIANVVELVRQAAEAAHALHAAGVIHRDIKPGNIMVSTDGRQAVLMDLGLAQLADDEDGRLTRTRQFVGTLRYASPQQVLAAQRLDCRSDVYSLGATLWELLALEPLFGATDNTPTPQLMERILHDEPAPLARHNPNIPRDLDAVVARCLDKRAERRYASARELALELARFLHGEPVQARPTGRLDRATRWIARHPAPAAAWGLSLLALLLVAVGGGAVWLWQQAEHARQQAEQNLALELGSGPSLEGPPELGEVYPDVESLVPDKQLIRTKPAGWRPPAEVDFRCDNKTGEPGLLLICNLTNHYQLEQAPEAGDPFSLMASGEWRTEKLEDSQSGAKQIPLYTGLGWYVLFMRTSRGDKPLYERNGRGEEFPLGTVNLCTAKHVVLSLTSGSFEGKKRYYAEIARQD
jgi:serine/threonine protein kinase